MIDSIKTAFASGYVSRYKPILMSRALTYANADRLLEKA